MERYFRVQQIGVELGGEVFQGPANRGGIGWRGISGSSNYGWNWVERYFEIALRSSGFNGAPQPVILFTSRSHCAGVSRCCTIMRSS